MLDVLCDYNLSFYNTETSIIFFFKKFLTLPAPGFVGIGSKLLFNFKLLFVLAKSLSPSAGPTFFLIKK